MRSGHDRQPGGDPPVSQPRIPVETEHLDLDHDGVPDTVQITEILEYDTRGAIDVVEEIRELDTGIGADGVPTTVPPR